MENQTKVLKRYPKAKLETCGDKYHKRGCYISLREIKDVSHSEEISAVLDFNKKGDIVGIDLCGFSW